MVSPIRLQLYRTGQVFTSVSYAAFLSSKSRCAMATSVLFRSCASFRCSSASASAILESLLASAWSRGQH